MNEPVLKHFTELSPHELYDIMRLRNNVFIVEQQCIFQDADGKDINAYHVMLYNDEQLVAYARLLAPGVSYPEMSIGRVVTSIAARGTGAGRKIMLYAMDACSRVYGSGPIKIGAQLYAKKFYAALGFQQSSDIYDEDGIDHIEMTYYAAASSE